MWAIHQSMFDPMARADRMAETMSEAEARLQYNAKFSMVSGANPEIYTVSGETANINISGVLTKQFSYFYGLFGGGSTSYADIISAISLAESNDQVKKIVFNISSGGGRVDGSLDAYNAIKNASKPTEAIIESMAASAAFLLASGADKILASSKTDMFGSIGVVQTQIIDPYYMDITNRDSPNKRPDVTTPEGKSVIQDELDPIHNLLVAAISEGRSAATGKTISADVINKTFGKGSVFIADEAIARTMIDGYVENSQKVVNNEGHSKKKGSSNQNSPSESNAMNMNEIKEKFPEVHAAIIQLGVAQGRDAGIKAERERVLGHLSAAKGSGLSDKAFADVEAGTEMTEARRMEHLTAQINKGHIANQVADNQGAATAATTDAANKGNEDTQASKVDNVLGSLADEMSPTSGHSDIIA
jgi:ClpP class serine protease